MKVKPFRHRRLSTDGCANMKHENEDQGTKAEKVQCEKLNKYAFLERLIADDSKIVLAALLESKKEYYFGRWFWETSILMAVIRSGSMIHR